MVALRHGLAIAVGHDLGCSGVPAVPDAWHMFRTGIKVQVRACTANSQPSVCPGYRAGQRAWPREWPPGRPSARRRPADLGCTANDRLAHTLAAPRWRGVCPGGDVAKLCERIFVKLLERDTVCDTVGLVRPRERTGCNSRSYRPKGASRAVRGQTSTLDGSGIKTDTRAGRLKPWPAQLGHEGKRLGIAVRLEDRTPSFVPTKPAAL
jgi:hypothetical protein